ncbi:MAG: tail fiber domain-containing protein [Candidatus Aminicenantes bacterium]|nr:tail fiber domain-containing protein [Candidatus Aminicenantes bacterium]
MNRSKKFLPIYILMFLLSIISFTGPAYPAAAKGEPPDSKPVAEVIVGAAGITWQPRVSYGQLMVTVSRPDGSVFSKVFEAGGTPYLDISGIAGDNNSDGSYTYELRVIPVGNKKVRGEEFTAEGAQVQDVLTQSGHFLVRKGAIVSQNNTENLARPMDVVHADDVIVTGSLCVGFDCLTDGTENFGFDTMKMKENSIRVFFDDTSTSQGFPANDWRIIANDSSSGGGNYLAIEDSTGGSIPFKIEAGARTSALYVEDGGRVGIGTATPIMNLHIVTGNTPTVRLDQDTTSGWTAQVFDIGSNESNFFIRDVTGGSKMPIRIQPGTPTNTLTLKSDGNVGIGTWSPTYALEIDRTGTAANLICKQTDGASGCIVADASHVFIGAKTNHDFRLVANDSVKMTILPSGNVGIGTTSPTHLVHLSGGAYSDGATWTDSSSRVLKENIQSLGTDEALNALNNLIPVKFNYKADKEEKHVGFIAEDAPELVATKDRKGMSPMDVAAVLTKIVQEQQKSIREQQKALQEQQKAISELKDKIAALEKK